MKILIVDDAEVARNVIRDCLQAEGHEIIGEAIDGEDGLCKYRELNPELVILDISMPYMDGIACLKQIIKINANAKVIICSALDQRELMITAMKCGAKDYVTKPLNKNKLIQKINKLDSVIK